MSGPLHLLWRVWFHNRLGMAVVTLCCALIVLIGGPGLFVFVDVGLTALLTVGIRKYSFAGGSLGLPNHTHNIKLAQGWFLAFNFAIAGVMACALGMRPLAATAFAGAAAAGGILFATNPLWLIGVPLVIDWSAPGVWLDSLTVHVVAIAVSGWVFWQWFQLPERTARAGGVAPSRLADATHERNGSMENQVDISSGSEKSNADGRLRSDLALLIGYSVETAWDGVLYGVTTAVLVLAWSRLQGSESAAGAYTMVTFACCLGLAGRLMSLLDHWLATAEEQAIVHLTPWWPDDNLIKRAVVESTLLVQPGWLSVWVASSIVAVLYGWIDTTHLFAGGVAVLGTSLVFSGRVWATLAHRQIQEGHLANVALVVIVATGMVTVRAGSFPLRPLIVYGAGMMMIPPALALAWYVMAPLRLPLNVCARRRRPDFRIMKIQMTRARP